MSEEAQQEAAAARQTEIQTGPLLPRWLTVTLYAVFLPWTVFAAAYLAWIIMVQGRLANSMQLVDGPWEGEAPAMDSAVMDQALAALEEHPHDALLHIIQELQQEELKDPRMAQAIVLMKAVRWPIEARRRMLLDEILENMTEKGEMDEDYELSAEHMAILVDLLKERREVGSTSYEENKISEVVQWIVDGRPTMPKGPEQRRIKSLKSKYAKKLFFGREKREINRLAENWATGQDPIKAGLVPKFQTMLEGEFVELTEPEVTFCTEEANRWESLYLLGRERLTQVALRTISLVADARRTVRKRWHMDHPHVWDLVSLLQEGHTPSRKDLAECVYIIRNERYALIYLSDFLVKHDRINPVMAVETARLTKDEHERILSEGNLRRRLECIGLLERIGKEYCREPFEIYDVEATDEFPTKEEATDEFVKEKTYRALEAVLEDKEVGARAQEAIDSLQEAYPEFYE